MLKANFCLIFLAFLSFLFQSGVFSFWHFGAISPQFWIVVTFSLFLNRRRPEAEFFVVFYFLFYDLWLRKFAPPFVESFVFILFLYFFRRVLSGYLERRILAPFVFFLVLNGVSLAFLGNFSFLGMLTLAFLNFVFFILFYPGLYLLNWALKMGEDSQLSLKI